MSWLDELAEASRRIADQKFSQSCNCRHYGKWRRYTTAEGYVGLGITRSPDKHRAIQIGRWVFTTSPCADED